MMVVWMAVNLQVPATVKVYLAVVKHSSKTAGLSAQCGAQGMQHNKLLKGESSMLKQPAMLSEAAINHRPALAAVTLP
jgi:hypothetical protein